MTDDTVPSFRGAQLTDVDFSGAWFRLCDFEGAVMRGVSLANASIDGWLDGLTMWGVEVQPLVEAELARRHPEYALTKSSDPEGMRAAWAGLERLWQGTLERVATMPDDAPARSVQGEWSLAQTLRHLVFATDGWLRHAVLGAGEPYHPIGVPFSEYGTEGPRSIGIDLMADPSWDEVLAVRAGRQADVRAFLASVTQEQLDATVGAPAWEEGHAFTAGQCLRVILEEEWLHRWIAERDLSALAAEAPTEP